MDQDLREILRKIINDFNLEDFVYFFRRKNENFKPIEEYKEEYEDENFSDCFFLGEITFENGKKLLIYALKVKNNLTERSGKRAQNEKGKQILKRENADAGIFIFYDDNKSFRFSLIYAIYKGTKRSWSGFRRYTYFVSPDEPNRTFLDQIGLCNFSSLESIIEAFSVEKVTEEFFEAYKHAIKIIKDALPKDVEDSKKHAFAQQLLSRILFIYFLQKKGWLKWKDYERDPRYIKNLWKKYKEYLERHEDKKDTFYSSWLSSLFFGAFNKKSHLIDRELEEEIRESYASMPYLNGGLFAKNELDEMGFHVPDYVFEWLFEPSEQDKRKGFLEIFNFTIDESSSMDVEVAVDPEMIGKVYESLIAEEERGGSGIFYTPRVEIDLMCRLALVEYLAGRTNIPKEKIIDFVFNPSENRDKLDLQSAIAIKSALEKVKIVDPAVGSASFLVGMMNILVDLHSELKRKIENREENLFALKQKIILENLYGVDVKDWAVMVGELRLWLSLIIETDEKYMDIYTRPLLPNLSFKIRHGDSLVEEIGGIQIALRGGIKKDMPEKIKIRIKELIDRKRDFFSGQRSADLKEVREIERLEHDIFIEILESKISEIEKKINSLRNEISRLRNQKDIFGNPDEKSLQAAEEKERQLEELEEEREKYKIAVENLRNKTKKDYFLWEVDFAEVFAEGGFDIVIGNPPYVRQELIAPPLKNRADYTEEEWRREKTQYKEKLISSVKNIWKNVPKIDKKSDLYVYFYFHGLSLLKEDGIFCFINSNSWLDVGYGACLQEFLLKNMQPIYIIDNLKKRSFRQADVNTVIVLIKRPREKLEDYTIKFIAFKEPFEEVLNEDVFKRIESYNQPVFDDEDFRVFPKTKKELLIEGVEIPEEESQREMYSRDIEHLPYIGNKWGGKYLRAPEIYFKILEKGRGKLVRLGDIAEVRFGIKTGANEFFYLKPIGMSVKEVVEIAEKNPDALIPVKNGAGWEGEIEARFLKPVIKSLKEIQSIIVEIERLQLCVFYTHNRISENTSGAHNFIRFGEERGYNRKPTCLSRNPWYILPQINGDLLFNMSTGDRYLIPLNSKKFFIDARLYAIKAKNVNLFNLLIVLNNSFLPIYWEVAGRIMTGSLPLLDLKVYELKDTWIFNPNILDIERSKQIVNEFSKRPIYDIFTELGFDPSKPIREQEPNPLPDRKALDDIVFDALGLTEEERKEVYWAVAELVKNRLEKARSV